LRKSGHTAIIVSHDPRIIATFCDRAVLIDGRRLAFEGTASEVADRYVSTLTHSGSDGSGGDA
jgi:lipopolysaccharide transport system ATP-binding protein